jgi:flagellin-like protein
MFKNRKAISPVIATVILVAVAITIAVAVSYWMGGITSQYTKFEKVEITSAQCVRVNATAWTISLDLKNSGTATATLISAYVNENKAPTTNTNIPAVGTSLSSGQTTGATPVTITISSSYPSGNTLSSGTTVNIKIHSAGGMDYIKLVELV